MSAEVESLFYTDREVPWHGLGVPVHEAPTSADAIHYAGLDWSVTQEPIQVIGGKKCEDYVANVRSSDGKTLGIVTDRYKIVQNAEAFDFTDSLLGEGVTYETAGSLFGGKAVWLLAKMPAIDLVGDEVIPYLCFYNRHDGKGSINVFLTDIRVVCNNTLNLAMKKAKRTWTARHAGRIDQKLEEARNTLEIANDYNGQLIIEADRLANLKLSEDEFTSIVYDMYPIDRDKDSDCVILRKESTRKDILNRYKASDIVQFRGTAWGAVNAFADYSAHVIPSRQTDTYQSNKLFFESALLGKNALNNFYQKIAA